MVLIVWCDCSALLRGDDHGSDDDENGDDDDADDDDDDDDQLRLESPSSAFYSLRLSRMAQEDLRPVPVGRVR